MTGVTWHEACPVSLKDLVLVTVSHWVDSAHSATGELVVAKDQAEAVVSVFEALYSMKFPVPSLRLMHHFSGKDDTSMRANNTSGFNCRVVTGTTTYSQHSYGTAIDINPLWNPWVKGDRVSPAQWRAFVDRTQLKPGLIREGDGVVAAFGKQGWHWGGHWKRSVDYQHFSVSGR